MKKNKKEREKKIVKEKPEGYIFGRPTMYSDDLADEICYEIARNQCGLRKLCDKNEHWPEPFSIIRWRLAKPDFCAKYDTAKKFQAELLVEDIIDISRDKSEDYLTNQIGEIRGNPTAVARAKLITDNIKWQASKVMPKIYGEAKKEIVFEKQNLADMDLEDRIQQIESLSLDDQKELFGLVAIKIKESMKK